MQQTRQSPVRPPGAVVVAAPTPSATASHAATAPRAPQAATSAADNQTAFGTIATQTAAADFGPSGYDPASVDDFVHRAGAQIDALLVDNLRAHAELDALRTRMCNNAEPPVFAPTDERLNEQFTSAAHVIRTAIDTAERRASQLVHDAEQTATNLRSKARSDAACSLQAAAAMADLNRSEAQAACERMMRAAHEEATQLRSESAMRQLDAVEDVAAPNGSVLATPGDLSDAVTLDRADELGTDEVKRERTFEALWHASTDLEDPDMDRYFQRDKNEKASF